MLRELMQKLIEWGDGRQPFFDPASLAWTHGLEADWAKVRRELDALLLRRSQITNLQDLSPDQAFLTTDDSWKTFLLFYYGHAIEDNCARCPETVRLLNSIPGMRTAMFSILAPGKHIPRHRGLYNGLVRCHLGLIVPSGKACRINVDQETRNWEEGKCLVFDDSRPHEVWNDSGYERVVLLFDFDRPLTGLLDTLNKKMLWRLSSRPFVLDAVQRARERRLPEGNLA